MDNDALLKLGLGSLFVAIALYWLASSESPNAPPAAQTVAENVVPKADAFDIEVERFRKVFSCPTAKVIAAEEGLGRLYSCVIGAAQTAKYFISELPGGGIEHIKVLWNDWFQDGGFDLHSDRTEVMELVKALARIYAPSQEAQLLSMIRSNEDREFEGDGHSFAYTYHRGPKIDERMIVVRKWPLSSP